MADYYKPSVTGDVVVFNIHAAKFRDDGAFVNVVLVKRSPNAKAFPNAWAIPGGFIEEGERVEECAARELKEETGIDVVKTMFPIGVFSDPKRDPRGPVISNAFAMIIPTCDPYPLKIKAGDDAAECCLFNLKGSIDIDNYTINVSLRCAKNGARIAYKAKFSLLPYGIRKVDIVYDPTSTSGLAFDHAEIIARAISEKPDLVRTTNLMSPIGTDVKQTVEKK